MFQTYTECVYDNLVYIQFNFKSIIHGRSQYSYIIWILSQLTLLWKITITFNSRPCRDIHIINNPMKYHVQKHILAKQIVTRSLVLCAMICRSFFPFVFFLLAIFMSVLLRFMDSDYSFGIFKHVLSQWQP